MLFVPLKQADYFRAFDQSIHRDKYLFILPANTQKRSVTLINSNKSQDMMLC